MVRLEVYEGVQIIGQEPTVQVHFIKADLIHAVIPDETNPENDCVVFISNKAVPVKVRGNAEEVASRVK